MTVIARAKFVEEEEIPEGRTLAVVVAPPVVSALCLGGLKNAGLATLKRNLVRHVALQERTNSVRNAMEQERASARIVLDRVLSMSRPL